MKKAFQSFVLMWAILLAIFNVIVFAVRPIIPGYVISYDARFWVVWGAILVAFIGQLLCAAKALLSGKKEKLFLNIPLITMSRSMLIAMTIFGIILMLIPDCPAWIAIIVCVLVLGFNAISILKADLAAETVSKVDEKVRVQTFFIKSLTVDADTLMASAKSDAIKAECKKVYEAIRYSDPMSSDALSSVESQISIAMTALSNAVARENEECVKKCANDVIILVKDRNNKCKLLK